MPESFPDLRKGMVADTVRTIENNEIKDGKGYKEADGEHPGVPKGKTEDYRVALFIEFL